MTKIVSEAVQRDKCQLSKRANRNKGNVTYQQTANMKHRCLETTASKWNWTSTSIRRCSIARLYWEVTLHSNKRRSATLFHHFDIVNSFWPVKLYSIFDQHLDLVVSIATRLSLHSISLFRVENTSFRIVAWGILCHSSPRKRRRSAIVLCSVIPFWTALPRISHTCSIQLRSGNIAGHSKRLTLLACRNPSTFLAWCGLALSSWKMPLLPIGRRKGTTWGHKILSM